MYAQSQVVEEPDDVADIWDKTVHSLREHYALNARQASYLRKVKPLAVVKNNVYLAVPDESTRTYLEANLREELSAALSEVFGYDVGFAIQIEPSLSDSITGPSSDGEDKPLADPFDTSEPLAVRLARPVNPPMLNPNYTFKTFVTGSSNRMAHATSFAVAEAPSNAYNPHFIYGGSGLGKTHLLHAIGHYAFNLYPHLRIKYTSAESFLTEFIDAIANATMPDFRQRYRDIDVLLIDDIQFLGGRNAGLEEFFHTFEVLHGSRRQVVITSDMPPNKLVGFEERFTSRFSWGMIASVEKPELETRIAILRRKRESQNIDIDDEILNHIATKIMTNIRELEGALTRVAAFASLSKQPITMQLTEDVLRDIVSEEEPLEISAQDIMDATARYFGLTVDDLVCKSRLGSLVEARSIAMYLSREMTDLSFPDIGRLFNRDHSTVMAACRKVTSQFSERQATFNQVTELTARIKQR